MLSAITSSRDHTTTVSHVAAKSVENAVPQEPDPTTQTRFIVCPFPYERCVSLEVDSPKAVPFWRKDAEYAVFPYLLQWASRQSLLIQY